MFSVTTWNINSVRLRIQLIIDFLQTNQPDILCLQETKCPNEKFPHQPFIDCGYQYHAINGQKGYNGVAIIAKKPLHNIEIRNFAGQIDSRHIKADIETGQGNIAIHNFYIPAGGDEPDPEINPKFAHKLSFLDDMDQWINDQLKDQANILVGDFNIAPYEADVWSHKQLLKVVSHTPIETDALEAMRARGHWADIARTLNSMEKKIFSWWSYRSSNWRNNNRGRRLDHIWASAALADKAQSIDFYEEERDREKPSDHIPVTAVFNIE